ncbi:MAG TPA: SRPBCC family protein [Actinomycetota bacterium]|nr:SRPBCC family protein [Actinomycetota bacterium]
MAGKGTAHVTLPTDTQILITRGFDAPPRLVYRAYTTPELIERWWSGERGEVTKAEVDLRVGGTWRYVMVANAGFEVAFHGEFREIVPDERLVNTEVFEGVPDPGEDAPVVTTTFAVAGRGTLLTQLTECGTREVRDMIIDSGMEAGMQEAMDRLEEVAISLA